MRCQFVFNGHVLFDQEFDFVPNPGEEVLIPLSLMNVEPVDENNMAMFKIEKRSLVVEAGEKYCLLYAIDDAQQVKMTRGEPTANQEHAPQSTEETLQKEEEPQPDSAEAQSQSNKEMFKKNIG
jgi:hypothetical protein